MQGDVKARRITVEGTVDGDLYALDSVVLRAGAIVRGNVFANKVSVAEGAKFSGRIDMDNAPTVPSVTARTSGGSDASGENADLTDQQVGELLAKA
jgi:cytoskeletal protein CcmA (bactofilin family)